ncbi:PepSY domain-containing protein [Arthrobacter sp.]|uniref:PepSY domain-containing protein n=1 Tax=Arthrobacter sp. TaxID=1667 RepID=UPI00289D8009|nr:PepSY domain-containing protein [Arthrobacter sp.]
MHRGAQAAVFAAVIALTGCTNSSPQEQDTQPTQPAETSPSSSPQEGSGTATSAPATGSISLGDAGSIVTDQYGGEVIGVEDDDFRGTPAWEVEVKDSNEGRIEVKVDKATGEILDVEQD